MTIDFKLKYPKLEHKELASFLLINYSLKIHYSLPCEKFEMKYNLSLSQNNFKDY